MDTKEVTTCRSLLNKSRNRRQSGITLKDVKGSVFSRHVLGNRIRHRSVNLIYEGF